MCDAIINVSFAEFSVVEVFEDSDSDYEDDVALDDHSHEPVQEEESFRCIMCEKSFRHRDNLKVHLQTHLGAKAQLKSCIQCKR